MRLQILAVFLLALSSNLDNVGVGTSYGTREINIPFGSNLLIAVITTTGTYLSMTAGNVISNFVSPNISSALGALMIGGTGAWVFIREIFPHDSGQDEARQLPETINTNQSFLRKILNILDHPFLADTDFSGHIDMKEGFFLALALTLNNLSNGVGAGLLKLDVALMVAFTAILSIVAIWFGIEFGRYSGVHWFGKYSGRIAGLILICLGIYEYFG
jgi:putative sporulation protein YtaF